MSNYSNNNEYGNNQYNNNQPYNLNYGNNYNQQKPSENLLKSTKKASITYIILFFLTIILTIAGSMLLISWILQANSSLQNDNYYDNQNYDYKSDLLSTDLFVSAALIAVGAISGILLFIISIVLTIKSEKLKNYSNDFDVIFILFVVGIFIGLSSLIASFMSISKVNKNNKIKK